MKRYIVKKRKIPGRGGDPKLDEWYIIDTKHNSPFPGGAHICEVSVKNLCNSLNNFHETEEVSKSFRGRKK